MLPLTLTYSDDSDIKPVSLVFEPGGSGWIKFALNIGEQQYKTWFSEVYDPLPALKRWLEAIAIGVEQCSFSYDMEGEEARMNYNRRSWKKNLFCVGNEYGYNEKPYISGYVDPKQLVSSFYYGFREFFNSDHFIKEKWEARYVWEDMASVFKINYDQLIAAFSGLSRHELAMLLSFNLSSLGMPVPEITGRGNEWEQFIKKLEDSYNAAKKQDERNGQVISGDTIPEDYDQWSISNKMELIEHEIHISYVGYGCGEKVALFQSDIIESFIEIQPLCG